MQFVFCFFVFYFTLLLTSDAFQGKLLSRLPANLLHPMQISTRCIWFAAFNFFLFCFHILLLLLLLLRVWSGHANTHTHTPTHCYYHVIHGLFLPLSVLPLSLIMPCCCCFPLFSSLLYASHCSAFLFVCCFFFLSFFSFYFPLLCPLSWLHPTTTTTTTNNSYNNRNSNSAGGTTTTTWPQSVLFLTSFSNRQAQEVQG